MVAEADDHDALDAAFRPEGTFTYRRDIDFFSFRYEIRVKGDDQGECEVEAAATAEGNARTYLDDHALSARDLTVSAIEMADVWR